MAEYELPPLRIKIVGDGKSFQKTVDASVKAAQAGADDIAKIQKDSAKSAKATQKDVEKETKRHWNRLVRKAEDSYRNMGKLTGFGKSVATAGKTKRQGSNSPFANLVKEAERGAKEAQRNADKEQSEWRKRFNERVARRKKEDAMYRKRTELDNKQVTSQKKREKQEAVRLQKYLESGRKKIASLDSAIHQAAFQANQKVEAQQRRQLAVARQAAAEASRTRRASVRDMMRGTLTRGTGAPRRVSRAGGRSGGDGGMGFLGDRADIYMHINAVRNLASAWSSPLRALTEYQKRVAGLSPQMGGTAQAESFLKGMRGTTTGQVYGAEIPTAATRLLGANIDLQTTKDLLASIGDIAGGDADRFQGLARAFSQVAAQGNLQGDELEQLAEQNFPLLQLMSQRTGIAQDVLREKMAKRQITAQAVFATVKAETAQGGKYAGMLNSLSNTLGVAVQRVSAFYEALQVEVMKTVAADLVKYVNKLASGIVHITNWVQANQAVVKTYVELLLKISAAIVLFHGVGLAVAMVSWQMHALRRIMSVLIGLTVIYNGAKRILVGTFIALRAVVVATVASMFICRAAMAGLVATSIAWYSGIAVLTTATWAYVASTRMAGVVLAAWNALMVRSVILSRTSAAAYMVINTALQVVRGTLAALRIGAILTWLAFLWPVAAVIAAVLAIVGVIQIAINSMGPGGFMGAIYGAWDAMKQFGINTIGFFMNIGHNSQVIAKYIYDNFWALVQDLGVILGRLFSNWASDSMLTFDTVAKLFGALMGWLVANAPAWGYQIANGMWKGFAWLLSKIKTGFSMLWEYAKSGQLAAGFAAHLAGVGAEVMKGATEGFLPAAADIIAEHQKNSALLNNWGDLGLQSPAIEGLKFDWQTFDMLGLADKIPDVDFGGKGIPGQDGTDIAGLFGPEKSGKPKSAPTTPMAVRAGSAEHLDRLDAAMMAQSDPNTKANAQIAANTGQTNVILKSIQQAMTKPSGNWTMKAEPAL